MEDTKFTPGPWCIASDYQNGRIGIGSTSGVVVSAPFTRGEERLAGVQGIANARLIAAAPDLYAALEAILEATALTATKELRRVHDDGVEALRKARGEA